MVSDNYEHLSLLSFVSTESNEAIHPIDELRLQASRELDPKTRSALGQFMTPARIAGFMASLFSKTSESISLIDPGAGIGSLTMAFAAQLPKNKASVHTWEIDPVLQRYLKDNIKKLPKNYKVELHKTDFIKDAVINHLTRSGPKFTHAILNPPYKKINSDSDHRKMLREVKIETVNLYTAFLALVILLMEKQGEIVAIIPRSFCNGTYYRPFRELLLHYCSIDRIHIFESRSKAFKDDEVLQENVIFKLTKNGKQKNVVVSQSHDGTFTSYQETAFSFDKVVKLGDQEYFIHIPTQHINADTCLSNLPCTLTDLGLEVCTGPVVDFRLRKHWLPTPTSGSVPLLYAHHFAEGTLCYPKEHKKPNALRQNKETLKWLMPRGNYAVTKRFTSKEERRRVVSYVVREDALKHDMYGFENHLNVFHSRKRGLDLETAIGLSLFLNSTLVDEHFRIFSGHTQVNATDLRQMRYPPRAQLIKLGKRFKSKIPSSTEIDEFIKDILKGG